jgi:anion-transporting  ArsA/GET3 family ATPase
LLYRAIPLPSPAVARPLRDHRFLFVVGKGGVGKTTIATALAIGAAKKGKRVLLALCNAKERVSYLLEVPAIGTENVRVAPNLDVVNMRPEEALAEYGMMILRSRTLYHAVFENRVVSALLRGTPGIEAWSMLGKAHFHTKETLPDGRPRYDLVIVDAPATGHGLEMLRVPKVITEVAPPGLLRREAEEAVALFKDPARSGSVLVTLAEDMPVNETIELHRALTVELGMPVAALVVNQVLPRLFTPKEREQVQALREHVVEGSPVRGLALSGAGRAMREQVQEESLARLAAELPTIPRTTLPMLFSPEFRRAQIDALAESFAS